MERPMSELQTTPRARRPRPAVVTLTEAAAERVRSARAELTFDPPWDASKMSDEAKLALNMF